MNNNDDVNGVYNQYTADLLHELSGLVGSNTKLTSHHFISGYHKNPNRFMVPWIFDFSSDPWGRLLAEQIHQERVDNSAAPSIFLCNDFRCWQNLQHDVIDGLPVVVFPVWLIDQITRTRVSKPFTGIRYTYGCLNGRRDIHRAVVAFWLWNRYGLDKIRLTYNDYEFSLAGPNSCLGPDAMIESILTLAPDGCQQVSGLKFNADRLKEFFNQLPLRDGNELYDPADHDIIDPAFSRSYVNIITETGIHDNGFCSEKTFKPIRAGQFFVTVGCPGTIKWLRDLGFDTFDDIFYDHFYDSCPDHWHRISSVLILLDYLRHEQWPELYQRLLPRIEKNQRWFYSSTFKDKIINQVKIQLQHVMSTR